MRLVSDTHTVNLAVSLYHSLNFSCFHSSVFSFKTIAIQDTPFILIHKYCLKFTYINNGGCCEIGKNLAYL